MSTTWFDPDRDARLPRGAYATRTRLMTNVYIASYRHPLETAKAFATVDALSGGRLIFGVGAGHVEGEFDALGVPFARARRDHRRGDRRRSATRGPTNGPRTTAPAGSTPTWASAASRRNAPIRRSGSADRASPRCAGSRTRRRRLDPAGHAARPARRRHRVPSSASATRCDRARCPRSATTRSCTSAMPPGTCPSTRSRAPTASSTRSTASARSASLTYRCASRRARPTSCCDQVTRFGAEIGPHLTRVALS